MIELIKVIENNGEQLVSAKELHEFLEVKSRFNDWIRNRIEKYTFEENQDFVTLTKNLVNGGREIEYVLKLDMAKELSMVENNEKGRVARKYFIECEKRYKNLNPLSMLLSMNKESLALTCIQLTQQVQEKDEIIISQTPKVEYHDNVLKSNGLLTMTMVAKDMSMSAKTLNAMLNVLGLIYKQSQTWYLYSEYEHLLEDGYFDYHISEHGQLLKATELGRKLIMKSIELKSVKLALKEINN